MQSAQSVTSRLPWNQGVADVGIALVVTAASFLACAVSSIAVTPLDVAAVLGSSLPLAVRRRYPIPVLVVAGSFTVAATWAQLPILAGLAVVIAYYTVVTHESRRLAVRAGIFTALGATLALLPATLHGGIEGVGPLAFSWLCYLLVLLVGDNLRMRRLYTRELEERAERLEIEREDEAWLAVAAERGRIARELHDVVAHHVSVMVIQAGGARRVAESDPAAAREALLAIESAGRTALTEMRRMLAVLRQDEPGIAPQPSLVDIDGLLLRVRDAGVPVELRIEGEPRELSAGLDLAAYRIVQEALTNTVKHAGGANANVLLRYGRACLEIEVLDDGKGALAGMRSPSEGGHGLIGMQERAALYGGQLEAGPRLSGGYRVWATLNYDQQPDDSRGRGPAAERDTSVAAVAAPGLRERHQRLRTSRAARRPTGGGA